MATKPDAGHPTHKPIRLAAEEYARPGAVCSVTVCLAGRRPLFARPEMAADAVAVLRARAEATGVAVYGYCVMPDHVHLVLGPSQKCSILTFVGQFKNVVQRRFWARGGEGKIWQASFWDHFLRADEDLADVVRYVLANPVRKGLCVDWRDYQYSGSMVFDP